MRLALALGALLSLAGCADIPDSRCQGDWQDLGYRDALKGYPSRHQELAKACGDRGFPVRPDDYQAGWSAGIEDFCSSDNGYDFGERGGTYQGTCPGLLDRAFRAGYERGRLVGQLQRRLDELDRRISDVENELYKPDLSREQYYFWRNQLEQLSAARRDAEKQLSQLTRY